MNANVQAEPESTELELIGGALQNFDRVSAGLALLEKNYKGMLYDVESPIGMDIAKAARSAIREPRYEVERVRKSAKAPLLALGKRLDAEATRITNALLILEEPIDGQIKAEEKRKEDERLAEANAKAKRIAELQARVDAIRAAVTKVANSNAVAVGLIIDNLHALIIDESFGDFRQQAEDAKGATIAKLQEIHAFAVEREAEQARIQAERAELSRLREEAAERDRQATAKRVEDERLAQVQRDAEAAVAKAEHQRLIDEARAHAQKIAADKAENDRVAEEQRAANAAEAARIVAQREALEKEQAAHAEALRAAEEARKPKEEPVTRDEVARLIFESSPASAILAPPASSYEEIITQAQELGILPQPIAASDPAPGKAPVRIYSAAEIHDLFKTDSIYGAEEFVSDRDYRELQNLLGEARDYVTLVYPQSDDEEQGQIALLARIDELVPRPALSIHKPPCDKGQYCCREQGHPGDCDDLPF